MLRLVEQARGRIGPTSPTQNGESFSTVRLEQFCTRDTFVEIFHDFVNLVYPVVPLVYLPTVKAMVTRGDYATNQPFLRQCIALAAATVASLPRKLGLYARNSHHTSVSSFVLRAIQLVQMSRVIDDPLYVSNPNTEHLTTSMMLCLAAHYASDTNQGWFYANEVSIFSRWMKLAEHQGYDGVPLVECELRKRAFWCCYIVQM